MKKKRRKLRQRSRRKKKSFVRKLSELHERASDGLFNLHPVFFYLGLIAICVFMFSLSWIGNEDEQKLVEKRLASDVRLDHDERPQPIVDRPELYDGLESSAGEDAKITGQLNKIIFRLEKNIAAIVEGGKVSRPAWLSEQFAGAGVDRDGFQKRYSDEQIDVMRWKASPSAPVLKGPSAFEKFVRNAMASWIGKSDFRIGLKVYENEFKPDEVVAKMVVEAFGRRKAKEDADGGLGVQSTSIWKTKWSKQDGNLQLENIQVQAQEEIVAKIPGGQLMRDCTASILKRCDSLTNQLVYGLDQWSRRIPGIDIVGNQGVAVGDINKDGLDDIYVCQPHGLPNLLLVQNPDGTVDDVSRKSRVDVLDESHAALMIDIDNDGDQDLILSTDENLVFMSNKGDTTYQLEHSMILGANAQSISAADFDQDGDLDLFLCKYQAVNRQNDLLMFPANIDAADDGGRNILLRNDEGWKFTDVTQQVGITNNNSYYSRSANWVDYDFDGDCDLYVANEFSHDQFFENQDGWFSEVSDELGLKISARHRSVSVGEFNQDGRFDFFVATDVPLSALRELNDDSDDRHSFHEALTGENQIWFSGPPGEKFSPFFLRAPIFSSESAFGSTTADLNNDGLDDVVVTNGFLSRSSSEEVDQLFYENAFLENSDKPTDDAALIQLSRCAHDVSDLCRQGYSFGGMQRNRCYLSIGQLGFANLSSISGIDLPDDARAVATTDWDNDGDPDLVMTCRGGPQLRIFCNQLSNTNNFVHFDLVGTESNQDAIGARVELYLDGREAPLIKAVQAGSGNLSQSTKRLMFGLGSANKIKGIKVFWPNGKQQSFDELVAGSRYRIVEGQPKLAESVNERFDLSIPPKTLDGLKSLPQVTKAAVFYPPTPIPGLQFQNKPKEWFPIEPSDDRPMLALFYSPNAASEKCLARFAKTKQKPDTENDSDNEPATGIEYVGVMVDQSTGDHFAAAKRLAQKNGFPHRCGNASQSTIDKLALLSGEWFNDQRVPATPFAVLLNSKGDVCSFYPTESIDVNQIVKDVAQIGLPESSYRLGAAHRGGRWISRYRTAKLNRIATRLREVGYHDDVKIMQNRSVERYSYEVCQKAIELDSQGEVDKAKVFFRKAIQLNPKSVPAYVGEGNLMRRLAKNQTDDTIRVPMQLRAKENFEYALSIDPLNTEAIIGRANIAIDQNRISDALKQLTAYLQIDPERYEVHAIVGRLLFFQKKYPEAAKFLSTAFEKRPTLPFVAGDLGFLYLCAGEYEEAQKFLKLANRLQPSDKNVLRFLAEAEFMNSKFDEAVRLFEQVTKDDPNRRRSKNVLAWALATCPYENTRDGEQALAIIDPMVQLIGETSPSTLEIYAACHAEVGDFKKALEYQEKAVRLVDDSDSTEAYSEAQEKGMRARAELYRRRRPYRMADLGQIPISPPGRKQK